ncbi:MAG: SLC13 family permease [Candidatus Marsarchaeota archaeon]|nr:SLC13 family permease [Candidatus Marsarchaeota archaeon]
MPKEKSRMRLVRKEPIFFFLLVAYALLVAYNAKFLNPALVEWDTVAIIASFLIINTGLLISGGIDAAAYAMLGRIKSFRKLALASIALTVIVSMFITNDASLIVLVPLTMSIGRISGSDVRGTVVLQAIGANVGSMLTPFGNPQNIIMFRHYGLSALQFILGMLPIFLISILVLAAFAFLISRTGRAGKLSTKPLSNKALLAVSILLFVADVVGFLGNYSIWFFMAMSFAAIAAMIVLRPKGSKVTAALFRIDVFLILTFVLIFLVINSAATLLPRLHTSNGVLMFLYALAASQLISNVPATVLLQKSSIFAPLSWGVNVGGNGTVIASLANFIAIRQGGGISPIRFMKLSLLYTAIVALFAIVLIAL